VGLGAGPAEDGARLRGSERIEREVERQSPQDERRSFLPVALGQADRPGMEEEPGIGVPWARARSLAARASVIRPTRWSAQA
jgi:hypothetical protein